MDYSIWFLKPPCLMGYSKTQTNMRLSQRRIQYDICTIYIVLYLQMCEPLLINVLREKFYPPSLSVNIITGICLILKRLFGVVLSRMDNVHSFRIHMFTFNPDVIHIWSWWCYLCTCLLLPISIPLRWIEKEWMIETKVLKDREISRLQTKI